MSIYMITAPLDEIYNLISKVPKYPISVGKLIDLARETKTPKEVVDFYRTFSRSLVFEDKNHLIGSSEQVDIMREEGLNMPKEEERSPEEY